VVEPPAAFVELLHGVPSRVRVSSQVKNSAIAPKHLLDRDFNTAWNSRTGELEGTWIDISVEQGAIHELRFTVGHTGVGPEGEDYFEMNPRIRTVSLLHAGGVVKMAALDTSVRTLQRIELPAPAADIRLRIDDVEMGSKAKWREVCISELEAWGTAPADALTPREPPIAVGDSDEPVIEDIAKYCAQNTGNGRSCKLDQLKPIIEPPWLGIGVLERVEAKNTVDRRVAIQTARGWWTPTELVPCGRPDDDGDEPSCRFSIAKATVSAPDTIEITYSIDRSEEGTPSQVSRTITCRIDRTRVTCSEPH